MLLEELEKISDSVYYKKLTMVEEDELMSTVYLDKNSIFGLIDDSTADEYKFLFNGKQLYAINSDSITNPTEGILVLEGSDKVYEVF